MENEFVACVQDLVATLQGLGGMPVVLPGLSDHEIDAAFSNFPVAIPLELRLLYRTFGGVRREDRQASLSPSDFGPGDFLFPTAERLAQLWLKWDSLLDDVEAEADELPQDFAWWRGWYPVLETFDTNQFLLIDCRLPSDFYPHQITRCTPYNLGFGNSHPEVPKVISLFALLETWLLWAKTGNIRIENGQWRIGENLNWTTTRMGLH